MKIVDVFPGVHPPKYVVPNQILTLTSSDVLGCAGVGSTSTVLNPADWLGQRVEWHGADGTIIGVTSTFTVAIRMDDGSAILSRPGDFSFLTRES